VKKILIMGLPGSGKTMLASALQKYLQDHSILFHVNSESIDASKAVVKWINADDVRKKYNDWDFSHEGRIRQSIRMRELADSFLNDFVIADFVAPLPEMRNNFKADWTIWVDTIDKGRFEDTNKMFVPPEVYDFRVTEQNCEKWAEFIGNHILAANQVKELIKRDLDPLFQGQYEILLVPNIVNITYGRDVGYKIEQEVFDDQIHAISATKIREQMGLK